jgi:hypothetical protein
LSFVYLTGTTDQFNSSFVDTYKIDVKNPAAWTKISTVDWTSVQAENSSTFCPNQIKFDAKMTTTLHILSSCSLSKTYNNGVKIFTLDVENKSGAIRPTVDVDITPGQEFTGLVGFCPFDDNFVVYSLTANTVIMVSKNPSLSHYTVDLDANGLTNSVDFHCMSNSGMYGVKSTTGAGTAMTYTYGLFWGNSGFNNGKFINQIWANLSPTVFASTHSFGLERHIITVDVDSTGEASTYMTLIEPPFIFLETGDLADQNVTTKLQTLNITVSDGSNTLLLSANITTVK